MRTKTPVQFRSPCRKRDAVIVPQKEKCLSFDLTCLLSTLSLHFAAVVLRLAEFNRFCPEKNVCMKKKLFVYRLQEQVETIC